ncbi:PfkB family carbohydrate kinase [Cystobacter fuscus]|uniref:PfkB family carbohydrate kinase n=1 Tax=Cystobacter fuscus TaxID=43 RepID=UPI0037BF225F
MTVVGSVLADYVVRRADQELSELPFRHGGVARNVAENLGWMGARVELVTLLSPGAIGDEVRERLEQAGVRVRARVTDGGVGRFVGLRDEGGEVRRQQLVTPPYSQLDWAFVREQLAPGGGYVVLETGLHPELMARVVEHAREVGLFTVAMPTRIREAGLPMALLRGFRGVVANGLEVSAILGMDIQDAASAAAGVRRLLDEGLTWAIVTLGARGVVAGHQGQEPRFYPALKASVASTLGAGDAFASGFMGGLSLHGEFSRAVEAGLEMARRTVEVEEAVRRGPCEEVLMGNGREEPSMVTTIGFDADDTLWHNENLFADAQALFRKILAQYHSAEWIDRKLLEAERRNLEYFGYGAKGFALSMIETAIELTEGRITGSEIQRIIDVVKGLLKGPTNLLDGAKETVSRLAQSHRLLLITKGELFEQEAKLARSGLAELFHGVEIVSEKNIETYRRILVKHGIKANEFLMVGNSVRSDILPVVELGGRAVHVPYHLTWAHEVVDVSSSDQRFATLKHLGELVDHLKTL